MTMKKEMNFNNQDCHSRSSSDVRNLDSLSPRFARQGMTRSSESGRSMVEMLGVLAIIGVLSVAGIAGYTSAMRSYRTNEIVNAVSTLYVMGMAQNQGNGNQELVYAGNIATNNPSGVTNLKYTTSKTVTMTMSDADDCAIVKAKLGDKITGECASLTVSFGDVSTSTPPVVNPTNITDKDECLEKNYFWLRSRFATGTGCYASEAMAEAACDALGGGWGRGNSPILDCYDE